MGRSKNMPRTHGFSSVISPTGAPEDRQRGFFILLLDETASLRNIPASMLSNIKLRHFRCFESLECDFAPGANVIYGLNAQGKTSLLEAACACAAAAAIALGDHAGAGDPPRAARLRARRALPDRRHLQFYFSRERKKDRARFGGAKIGGGIFTSRARGVFVEPGHRDRARASPTNGGNSWISVAVQIDPLVYRRHLRAYESGRCVRGTCC